MTLKSASASLATTLHVVSSYSCNNVVCLAPQNISSTLLAKIGWAIRSSVAVLRLNVISESLGFRVFGSVVVTVVVVLGTDIVHLVDAAALGTALNGTILGDLKRC